jgi:hypothetical protein
MTNPGNPKMNPTTAQLAADKLFRKRDKEVAVSEYEAAKIAQAEKTARLRALRLAKEANDREIAEKAASQRSTAKGLPPTKAAPKPRSARAFKTGSASSEQTVPKSQS